MQTTTAWRGPVAAAGWRALYAFAGMLGRDVYVTLRQLPAFLLQVVLQPLFLLFIFGKVLISLGYTNGTYVEVLLPGVVALTVVITGLQSTAFPLVVEFSYTREIEDRLLAPISTSLIAVEKIIFGAARALVAGLLMFPISFLVLGPLHYDWSNTPLLVLVLVLGSALGSGIGLALGTLVPPQAVNVTFGLILTPLLFTGCSQYPWPSLANLRWFQVLTLFNPLTYVSEGMRVAMVPSVPHIDLRVCLPVMVAAVIVSSALGVRGFVARAVA
jgi:ABC-2 type transport system permease protein